ncbi:MAG: hypothetical protein JWQ33_2372 [Ramlibacter sp.]|nr:hypothetical protein [Ramlibacter sp.]
MKYLLRALTFALTFSIAGVASAGSDNAGGNGQAKSGNDNKQEKKLIKGHPHDVPVVPAPPSVSPAAAAALKDQVTAAVNAALADAAKKGGSSPWWSSLVPPAPNKPAGPTPKALVLYDAPAGTEFEKLDFAYAIMLRNLLGHFDAQVDLLPVQAYTAGKVNAYDATFYLGGYYGNPLPKAFLTDAASTQKTLVWFKYNLWQVTTDASYNFAAARGFSGGYVEGLPAVPSSSNPAPGFYDTVTYKGKDFVKYYAYDAPTNSVKADPDIGAITITAPAAATALVGITNSKTGKTLPYVTRSGNFWYVADMPFSFIGPRDRYLVIADLLHDMLGVNHPESHQALVRLEDVGAMVSVDSMKTLSDYLAGKKIPFSIAVIPHYVDAFGIYNGNVPQSIPMSQATDLKTSLNYARTRGGEIVMHGYTHQYGKMKNPNTGVSGDDFEFWDIVHNTPVPEDSSAWALGRLLAGAAELVLNGYQPVAWETPHYQGSALSSRAASQVFRTTYQRVVYYTADKPNFALAASKDFAVGQIFPYVIKKDYYGQRVIPESLGNIEYDIHTIDPTSNYNYTPQDILANADYALTVRDGFASFFFHPFWLEPQLNLPGLADFKQVIDGISQRGFTWVAPSKVQ